MTQIQTYAIKLMDEWSLQGVREDGTFIADYTQKFPDLINICVNEISDFVGIYATLVIDTQTTTPADTRNGFNFYDLPADMKDFRYVKVDDWSINFNDYEIIDNQFKITTAYNNTAVFTLHYFRYPTEINDLTAPTFVPDIDSYTHYLIPYYIAGTVLMSNSEDTELSSKLLNIYSTKLQKLTKREVRYPRRAREVMSW